jgi:hypothetical protein
MNDVQDVSASDQHFVIGSDLLGKGNPGRGKTKRRPVSRDAASDHAVSSCCADGR